MKKILLLIIVGILSILISGCMDNEKDMIEPAVTEMAKNKRNENSDGNEEAVNINEKENDETDIKILNTFDYSGGRAWVRFQEEESNNIYYGCIDEDGKMLFVLNNINGIYASVTPFSNKYAYVTTEDVLVMINDTGTLVKQYSLREGDKSRVCAYADGYIWEEQYISGFDEAYYKYILYGPDEELLAEFEYNGTEPIDEIRYYEKGVWGYSTTNDEGEYIQRFYCTNSNKWVESNLDFLNIWFYEKKAAIGITHENEDETGYRARLHIMDFNGNLENVPISSEMGWDWRDKNFISEGYCILKADYLVAYNLSTGEFIKMDNKYADRVNMEYLPDVLIFNNNRVALPLIGDDGAEYTALFDTSWNIIGEPVKSNKFDLSENRFIIAEDVEDENIMVCDENGSQVFTVSDLGYSAITPYKNGIARVLRSDADETTRIVISRFFNLMTPSDASDTDMLSGEWDYIDINGELLFDTIDTTSVNKVYIQEEIEEDGEKCN